MKIKFFISAVFLGVFLITSQLLCVFFESGASGGGICCEAGSTVGSSCKCYCVNCPAPSTCQCSGGLFKAVCDCSGTPPAYSSSGILQDQLDDANDLADYCLNYGTDNMEELGLIIQLIVSAVEEDDEDEYSDQEWNYRNKYLELSSQEVSDIEDWTSNRGY